MTAQWDLAAFGPDEQLALVVEIKNKLNASPEWASQLKRNILAHGTFPHAPYFLIAFPDRFYLWTDDDMLASKNGPAYSIDARPILRPYFAQADLETDQISGQSLEFIVAAWLSKIMHTRTPDELLDESLQWLIDSGLYAAIAGGRLNLEVVT